MVGVSAELTNWYVSANCDLENDNSGSPTFKFTTSRNVASNIPFSLSAISSAAIRLKIIGRTGGTTDLVVKDDVNTNCWVWTLATGNCDTALPMHGGLLILDSDIDGSGNLKIDSVVRFNPVATTPPPYEHSSHYHRGFNCDCFYHGSLNPGRCCDHGPR